MQQKQSLMGVKGLIWKKLLKGEQYLKMKTTGALEKFCRAKNNHFSGTCYKK